MNESFDDNTSEKNTLPAGEDEPTCGKGLAANATLPATTGKLFAAQARVLEVHMKALDLTDSNSRQEYDAYQTLVRDHKAIAAALEAAANEMSGYRDLPMGSHDEQEMSSPEALKAFEEYVQAKQELFTLLRESAEQDQQMLGMMRDYTQVQSKS